MAERIAVLLIAAAALFARNASRKRHYDRRETWILILFAVPILYLSVLYVTNGNWINLHDLANRSVGRIAQFIVGWLEHKP
jgi:hypothetical protein